MTTSSRSPNRLTFTHSGLSGMNSWPPSGPTWAYLRKPLYGKSGQEFANRCQLSFPEMSRYTPHFWCFMQYLQFSCIISHVFKFMIAGHSDELLVSPTWGKIGFHKDSEGGGEATKEATGTLPISPNTSIQIRRISILKLWECKNL